MTDKERELVAEALNAIEEAAINFVKLADAARACVMELKKHSLKMRDISFEINPPIRKINRGN